MLQWNQLTSQFKKKNLRPFQKLFPNYLSIQWVPQCALGKFTQFSVLFCGWWWFRDVFPTSSRCKGGGVALENILPMTAWLGLVVQFSDTNWKVKVIECALLLLQHFSLLLGGCGFELVPSRIFFGGASVTAAAAKCANMLRWGVLVDVRVISGVCFFCLEGEAWMFPTLAFCGGHDGVSLENVRKSVIHWHAVDGAMNLI